MDINIMYKIQQDLQENYDPQELNLMMISANVSTIQKLAEYNLAKYGGIEFIGVANMDTPMSSPPSPSDPSLFYPSPSSPSSPSIASTIIMDTECNFENYENCTEDQRNQIAQQLIDEIGVNSAKMRAMRARNIDLIRKIDEIARNAAPQAPPQQAESIIPENAADCNNEMDITGDSWTETNQPSIKIRFLRENRTDCYHLEQLRQWYENISNTLSFWLPKRKGNTTLEDPNGYGYGPGYTYVTKLPMYNVYVMNFDVLLEENTDNGTKIHNFVAIYLGNHRIGNRGGAFGVGALHGQYPPGEPTYYLAENLETGIAEIISRIMYTKTSNIIEIDNILGGAISRAIIDWGTSNLNEIGGDLSNVIGSNKRMTETKYRKIITDIFEEKSNLINPVAFIRYILDANTDNNRFITQLLTQNIEISKIINVYNNFPQTDNDYDEDGALYDITDTDQEAAQIASEINDFSMAAIGEDDFVDQNADTDIDYIDNGDVIPIQEWVAILETNDQNAIQEAISDKNVNADELIPPLDRTGLFLPGISDETLDTLIINGADVNHRDVWGRTPIFYANSINKIHSLLASGADINEKDNNGQTPLHFIDNMSFITFLVGNGSDPNIYDNNGVLAWELSQGEVSDYLKGRTTVESRTDDIGTSFFDNMSDIDVGDQSLEHNDNDSM